MSKIHHAARAEKSRPISARYRSPQVGDVQPVYAETKQARSEVALNMIWHILHTHPQMKAHEEQERIIQW